MNVILCEQRFEQPILNGIKPNTIRHWRRDGRPRARVGETVSLRVWTGKPYRSKQREFAQAEVDFMFTVVIDAKGVYRLETPHRIHVVLVKRKMARCEGFANWSEMKAWFESHHGLPFEGVLIHWKNLKPTKL